MADEVGRPVMAGATQIDMSNIMGKRKLIRTAKNPLDKCTIVSIFPKEIDERKWTIDPGRFIIPAGSLESPAVLVVGGSSWWKDYDPDQPILEITNGAIQVAESVVRDYCNGMLGCDMGGSMPGLFYVIGEHTSLDIKVKYKAKLDEMNQKQLNWYRVLVRLADSLWSRTNGNPLAIWEEMKVAALALNLNEKAWLKDHQISELIRCFACGNLRNPAYPVCPTCKAIDKAHPAAKDIAFAP